MREWRHLTPQLSKPSLMTACYCYRCDAITAQAARVYVTDAASWSVRAGGQAGHVMADALCLRTNIRLPLAAVSVIAKISTSQSRRGSLVFVVWRAQN